MSFSLLLFFFIYRCSRAFTCDSSYYIHIYYRYMSLSHPQMLLKGRNLPFLLYLYTYNKRFTLKLSKFSQKYKRWSHLKLVHVNKMRVSVLVSHILYIYIYKSRFFFSFFLAPFDVYNIHTVWDPLFLLLSLRSLRQRRGKCPLKSSRYIYIPIKEYVCTAAVTADCIYYTCNRASYNF